MPDTHFPASLAAGAQACKPNSANRLTHADVVELDVVHEREQWPCGIIFGRVVTGAAVLGQ